MKNRWLILFLVLFLGLAAMAEEPGVFLPFYFLYGNVDATPGPCDVNTHNVVYYQSTPMLLGANVSIEAGKYTMNIMEAQYYGKFPVTIGSPYYYGVPKGVDNYGLNPASFEVSDYGYTNRNITLQEGEGDGLLPVAGTVPLVIERDGTTADIKISWDAATYGTALDFYYMTGDGTGQYTNTFSSWTSAASVLNTSTMASGYVKHSGQIGAGLQEVYYKAIQTGEIAATKVPLAWAVGKLDIDLTTGFNFVSMPLVGLTGTGLSENFADQLNVADYEMYYYNPASGLMTKAKYTTTWAFSPNIPFNIETGNAYWVKLPANKRISLLGAVRTTPFIKTFLANKYSTLGSAVPVKMGMETAGLVPTGTNQIFWFHNDTKLYEKLKNSGGWVNASPGQPVFDLAPGLGYWYYNTGSELDWTLPSP